MKKLLLIPFLFILFTSCNNPMERVFIEKTFQNDIVIINKSNQITEDEKKILIGYIILTNIGGVNLEGKTYNEILKLAKSHKEKIEKEEKDNIRKEEDRIRRFSMVLMVNMYDKGFVKHDFQDYITCSIMFENMSEKNIRAIKGCLVVSDLFDTEIARINLVVDDNIDSHKIFKNTYVYDYNQFMSDDVRFKNKDLKDLKTIWISEKIIFMDGTVLE